MSRVTWRRAGSIGAALTMVATMSAVAGSVASASPVPVATGTWGTITMPSDFHPHPYSNYFGVDASGNIYYVPSSQFASVRGRDAHLSARITSHTAGSGIERYNPVTQTSTFLDPGYDFTYSGGLAVTPNGTVDIIALDATLNQFVVMQVDPAGNQRILNSTLQVYPESGIAVDAVGNVYVSAGAQTGWAVWEIPVSGAPPVQVASGPSDFLSELAITATGQLYGSSPFSNQYLYQIASGVGTPMGASLINPWGLAADGNGNLFVADYGSSVFAGCPSNTVCNGVVAEFSPSGEQVDLPPTPALNHFGATTPTFLAYGGGTLYAWDAASYGANPPVLYTWSDAGSSRPLVTATSAAVRVQGTLNQSITATWTGGASSYRCTLLYGYENPSVFTVLTTTPTCTFGGLALNQSYGVSVVAINGSSQSLPSVAFAPPPKYTITCVRDRHARHLTGTNLRCPAGWRQR